MNKYKLGLRGHTVSVSLNFLAKLVTFLSNGLVKLLGYHRSAGDSIIEQLLLRNLVVR